MNPYQQLVVWPKWARESYEVLNEVKIGNLVTWFARKLKMRIQYVGCVAGDDMFFLHNDHIHDFCQPMLELQCRWWEDVWRTHNHTKYPHHFLRQHPPLW